MWGAPKTSRHKLAALAILSGVCFLRVGKTATIRPCDVEQAVLTFFRTKPKLQGWHRRPLAKYAGVWAKWLYDFADAQSLPWHAPLWRAGKVPLREPWRTCSRGPGVKGSLGIASAEAVPGRPGTTSPTLLSLSGGAGGPTHPRPCAMRWPSLTGRSSPPCSSPGRVDQSCVPRIATTNATVTLGS